MTSVLLGELIERAVLFEERLEQYYAQIRDESVDNGVRMLTYYLSRHRRHLEKALKDLNHDQIERINKIRLKYDIDFDPDRDIEIMKRPAADLKGNDLLEAAVAYDEKLVSLYRSIQNQPVTKEAEDLLNSLIRLEEKDIIMLKKKKAMNYF